MLTGELKNKVDSLWEIFWTGGLANPLDVIEQMTYLMFIHDLDANDNLRAKEAAMLGLPHKSMFAGEVQIGDRKVDGQQLKWSVFHDFDAGRMYSVVQELVFPFIKNLGGKDSGYSKYMADAIFKVPTPLMLSKIVDAMDTVYEIMEKNPKDDTKGDLYEYLLNKISQSGINGQFRTPRHIIKMMVELMQPKPDFTICDPACGTAGFLVASEEYLMANHKKEIFFDRRKKDHFLNHMFFGYDMDRTMLRIGAMNMMTHGVDSPFIEYRDSLSDQNPDKEKFDLILANPPFKGSLDADTVSADLLKVCKTKKTELLFLALFLRMLKVGGRCACIVPDGVLFGSSTAHKAIRKELVEGNRLEAVISMPSGVFKPYAGVSTGILIFTKTGHGGTDKVWFYDMTADGFSLDDKRSEIKDNDIDDILLLLNKDMEIDLDEYNIEDRALLGYEVEYDATQHGYKVSRRPYDFEELRLLAECVRASKFISKSQEEHLLAAIENLCSDYQIEELQNEVYLVGRNKTTNTHIMGNILKINQAIRLNRKVSFRYQKYTIRDRTQQVDRRGGATYIVSPFKLIINDGYYYLLAWDNKRNTTITYRLDRMKGVDVADEPREGGVEFGKINMKAYTQQHFGMFSGEKKTVSLRFTNNLLDTMVDRFGTGVDVFYRPDDDTHFVVTTQIAISDQFFGWLCGFRKMAKIVSPPDVVADFHKFLDDIYGRYEDV